MKIIWKADEFRETYKPGQLKEEGTVIDYLNESGTKLYRIYKDKNEYSAYTCSGWDGLIHLKLIDVSEEENQFINELLSGNSGSFDLVPKIPPVINKVVDEDSFSPPKITRIHREAYPSLLSSNNSNSSGEAKVVDESSQPQNQIWIRTLDGELITTDQLKALAEQHQSRLRARYTGYTKDTYDTEARFNFFNQIEFKRVDNKEESEKEAANTLNTL